MKQLKKLLLFIVFGVLSMLTHTLSAQTIYYVKASQGLNLRRGPSSNYGVVRSIPPKGKVRVMEQNSNGWWKVTYNGQEGYVSSKYLTEDKSKATSSNRKNTTSSKRSNGHSSNSRNTNSNRNNRSSNSHASDYDWGVGVRLGDPSGVTIKKELQGHALELSVGSTYVLSGKKYDDRYYNDHFNDWYHDMNYHYDDFQYIGYDISTPIAVQLHYLTQKDIHRLGDNAVRGLSWYYGFGGQFRFQTYTYDYRYKVHGDKTWYYTTGDKETDIDFGVDGVIGLEYTFSNAPISIFMDFTTMIEVFDNPFQFWFQGGLGVRYRF
ncbi:SH3 domain-containing protein [Halosquirtibacter laminarini]|uniref:SH3 domain-containing protein n=1 Tax=Halosquirtibacter laminarini TaxID=3374600 RepID=A0AC61NR93_9BACT|nr:SH3 domain-containing protein [Prolixibacteraceae bacterium]